MRWINRVGTITMLLIFVAGPPAATAVWAAHHRPTWPTRDQLQTWIDQPSAASIIAGCITAAGLGWLGLLYLLARQAVRAASRRRSHRHLQLPTPAQITASSMAGVAALTLPGLHADDHQPAPATATTSPGQPTNPTPPHHHATETTTGVTLPGGGWLPTSTALAVTVTATLIWLRRRQHYQPRAPHPDRSSRDHDLQPLPITADAISAALPPEPEPPSHDTKPTIMNQQLPSEVIHLDGPAAADAARGMIVTAALALATGQPTRPLHIDHADLARLLPATDLHDLTAAGILINTATSHEHGTHPEDQTGDQKAEPRGRAEPHTTIRLRDDPTATVYWHVAPDGTTTGTHINTPQRLCTVDRYAAADLITLVRQALIPPTGALRQTPTSTPTPDATTWAPLAESPTPAHLALIGGCGLTVAGNPAHLHRTASLQILTYLAIHPEGATKSDLIRACWPGQPPAAITQRLHTSLSDLRKQLNPLIGADPITRNGEHYTLNRQAISTDLQIWHKTRHTAANADSTDERLHANRSLIGQYRGDLAEGLQWPWLAPAREALRRDALDAYTAVSEARPAEAAPVLPERFTTEPHGQPLRRQAEH